jgi:aminomethyltransferase
VSLEKIYGAKDLPVQVTGRATRSSVPLYVGHRQVGYVTSHTFSPILKRYIGLATLETQFAKPGTELEMEFTVEHHRERGRAVVGKLPFYEPVWKREQTGGL